MASCTYFRFHLLKIHLLRTGCLLTKAYPQLRSISPIGLPCEVEYRDDDGQPHPQGRTLESGHLKFLPRYVRLGNRRFVTIQKPAVPKA